MRVPLAQPRPDYQRFLRSILREGRPDRMAVCELHCDREIMAAVLGKPTSPWTPADHVAFQHRMGYDYVNVLVAPGNVFGHRHVLTLPVDEGAAESAVAAPGSTYINEQEGPVQNWADFERFAWPDPDDLDLSTFDTYAALLPEGMGMNVFLSCAYFSKVTWTVGLQPFCLLLVDDRPLIKAIFDKWAAWALGVTHRCLQRKDIGAFWMSDDLGFNSGPFLPPADLREFIFPVFAEIGRMCRARGVPFILHSCGNLNSILGEFVQCGVNAFHSLPPQLYDLAQLKAEWGHKLAFLGNIDLNILGLGTPDDARRAVRAVRDIWAAAPAGGILLSSSNSIAHYCKLENYYAMMDEALAG